jgi:hypothetical protein
VVGTETSQTPEPPAPVACATSKADLEVLIASAQSGSQKRKEDLKPYELRAGSALRKWTLAHLYTPSLRVRMVARAAQLSYKPFAADDVPQPVCQNLVFISAWPWQGHSVRAIVLLPTKSVDVSAASQPVWTYPFGVIGTAILGSFWVSLGPVMVSQSFSLAKEETMQGLVAAFPPEAFTKDREVVIAYVGTFVPPGGSGLKKTNEMRFPVSPDWK